MNEKIVVEIKQWRKMEVLASVISKGRNLKKRITL